MQLVNLTITKGSDVVQQINFKSGANIITNTGDNGNQIGKSTSLRAINFCLGSDGRNLWVDPDNSNVNSEVRDLIFFGEVVFSLELNVAGVTYVIRRKVEEEHQTNRVITKIYSWINDEQYDSQRSFTSAIAHILGHTEDSPPYRSVKNRFIRISRDSANKALKYLTPYTSNDEYSIVYAYLFGFEGLDKLVSEVETKADIESLESRKSSLLEGQSLRSQIDKIESLNLEIAQLRQREDEYDLATVQESVLESLKESRSRIAALSAEVGGIETRIVYGRRTIATYEGNMANVDVKVLQNVYEEARIILPDIQKSVEDAIEFHNSIFKRKAAYVQEQNELLQETLSEKKAELNDAIESERSLVMDLAQEGHLSGFMLIEKALQEKLEERGRLSYLVDEIAEIDTNIETKTQVLDDLKREIQLLIDEFDSNLSEFNDCYGELTGSLFSSHKNTLKAAVNDDCELQLTIINEELNTGDGVPRASAMAFDMAMVEFAKKKGSKLLQFTLQDYLESIDDTKLTKLLQIANDKGIQTVVAVLSDKLYLLDPEFREANTVLSLSQRRKFFGI